MNKSTNILVANGTALVGASHNDAVDYSSVSPDATISEGFNMVDSLMGQVSRAAPVREVDSDKESFAATVTNPQSGPCLDQPLLAIGVGGSGRRIVTDMKASLLNQYGEMPSNARLLVFDSGAEVITTTDRFGRLVQLQDSEYTPFKTVPLANMKRTPDYHAEIFDRLGDGIHQVRRQCLINGAGQERIQGLTYMMYFADMIVHDIRRALHQVTERATDLYVDRNATPGINVVLAGSTGGGQGSGALLDIALLVREEMMGLGEWADVSRMVGLLVLPSAFSNLSEGSKRNIVPNTYAFLQELNMLMRGQKVIVNYQGSHSVTSTAPPFDHVYVVDGIDENGNTWPNLDEVCSAAARSMVLLYCSEVGREEVAYAINNDGVLNQVSPNGYGTFLGSFGLAELYYPSRQVAELCTLRYAQSVVDQMLNGLSGDDEAKEEEGTAIPLPNIQLTQLTLQIQGQEASQRTQLALPADIEESEPSQMLARTRTFATQYTQQRIYRGTFGLMKQRRDAAIQELTTQCEQWLERLDTSGYLSTLQAGLARHLECLYTMQTSLQLMQVDADEKVSQQKRALQTVEQAIDQSTDSFSFILRRRQQMQANCYRYLDAWIEIIRTEIRQRGLALTSEIVGELIRWAEGKLHQAQSTARRLQQGRERLARIEQQIANRSFDRNMINLADSGLVDMLYHQHAGAPDTSVQQVTMSRGPLTTWSEESPENLVRAIINEVCPLFAPLTKITVEDVLRSRWPTRTADDWMGMLENMAAGAWNIERAKLPPGSGQLASFLTIGVPNASDSLFADGVNTCTSTGDPERIVVLRTVYGAPIDALKAAPRWKQIYDSLVNTIEPPLHIFPGFQQGTDDGMQAFAIGAVFDFIYQNGSFYYCRSEDPIVEDTRLGQGLQNALAGLKTNNRLTGQLLGRIENYISQIGTNEAINKILLYVEKSASRATERDDELDKELLRTARIFADNLE